jgi:hypothetical protein
MKRNPKRKEITVEVNRKVYDRLHKKYPYAQMKALVNHILAEHVEKVKK